MVGYHIQTWSIGVVGKDGEIIPLSSGTDGTWDKADTLPMFYPGLWGTLGRGAAWTIAAGVRTAAVTGLVLGYLVSPPGNFAKDTIDSTKKEDTPKSNPSKFRPVKGRPGKVNVDTGEVWVRDPSGHGGEHYEVYDNIRDYENDGPRNRQVWADGTTGRTY